MSVGIEAWTRAEEREFEIGELVRLQDEIDTEILARHDEDSYVIAFEDDVMPVPAALLAPSQTGGFVVVTLSEDGQEVERYFGSVRTAQAFSSSTLEQVVSFEGLMD